VRFDSEAFAEDLEHATPAGRSVARDERKRLERDGIRKSELQQCAAEGRDGTRLGGCVRTYLPRPAGAWGMVFTGDTMEEGVPVLVYLAFGRRHPGQVSQPSVYRIAHRRLNLPPG
jgi:hypothetical protein